MTTNVSVFAVDGPVVIYLQDGSTMSVDAGQGTSLHLPEAHMCTISDTPPKQEPVNEEEGEHPPKPPEEALAFAERMVETWQRK